MNTMAFEMRYLFCMFFTVTCSLAARSIYRMASDTLPRITTRWVDDYRTYTLQHPNLEVGPLFSNYDPEYLAHYAFPEGPIAARHSNVMFQGGEIIKILEQFVKELQRTTALRAHYKDVVIIKKKDYNPRSHTGLIIVKLKNYPFVVKLFMETPSSFVSPFSKGFEPAVFFMMGSINRHISGFLRIKNAEVIRDFINDSAYWSVRVDIPRKWFWQPQCQRSIDIISANLGTHQHHVVIPSVYAIVADAIIPDQELQIFNRAHRAKALEFCHFVGIRVDPHINNFMIEQGSGKLILVDTEHFPSMVGLREGFEFENYGDWYLKLTCKGFVDSFGRTKDVRRHIQCADERLVLDC